MSHSLNNTNSIILNDTIPFWNTKKQSHFQSQIAPFSAVSAKSSFLLARYQKCRKMSKEQVDQEGLKTRGDILKAVNDLYDESSREDALTGR